MQHGTAREYAVDLIENVEAVLAYEARNGKPYGDLARALRKAAGALDKSAPWDIDERGVFGPDHAERRYTGHCWPVRPDCKGCESHV